MEKRVVVVGGGLAGLQAAQAAAGMGHPVVLVEKAAELGGYLAAVREGVPEVPPYDRLHPNPVPALVREVRGDQRIRVLVGTRIVQISGQPGQFAVEVESGGGREQFKVGAIVQATGALPYDAGRLGHLGYGKFPQVITAAELEPMLAGGQFAGEAATPDRVRPLARLPRRGA